MDADTFRFRPAADSAAKGGNDVAMEELTIQHEGIERHGAGYQALPEFDYGLLLPALPADDFL